MDPLEGLRAAMAVVDDYYKERTMGAASSHAIWDTNAAGWVSLVKPAPLDHSDFTPRNNQGKQLPSDLMSVWEWDELGQFIRVPLIMI